MAAVNCAVEIQTALKSENANLAPARRMEFRIGVNSGDIMVEGEQIYGDGVNVSQRPPTKTPRCGLSGRICNALWGVSLRRALENRFPCVSIAGFSCRRASALSDP